MDLIFFPLFFLGILQHCKLEECTFCITNTEEPSCKNSEAMNANTTELHNLNHSGCLNIQAYLTGGYHQLVDNLIFLKSKKEKSLTINGSQSSPTVINCSEKGFQFENSRITISQVAFHNCSFKTDKYKHELKAALVFVNVSYTLYRVTVSFSKGAGLEAWNCYQQNIMECGFSNNSGHIRSRFYSIQKPFDSLDYSVNIASTEFSNGSDSALQMYTTSDISITMTIIGCHFMYNTARENSSASHVFLCDNRSDKNWPWIVTIQNCSFIGGIGQDGTNGLTVWSKKDSSTLNITVIDCQFEENGNGAIEINSIIVLIENCIIQRNNGIGLLVKFKSSHHKFEFNVIIRNCHFVHNQNGAIQMQNPISALIDNCFISSNREVGIAVREEKKKHLSSSIEISNTLFEKNFGRKLKDCSSLHIKSYSVTLNNLSFIDNHCTGIILESSILILRKRISMTGNTGLNGGALQLNSNSSLHFEPHSQMSIVRNTAVLYGGGIYR